MAIKNIDYDRERNGRVETGVVQFGEDWPGYFVRGDDIAMITCAWKILQEAEGIDSFYKDVMQSFVDNLQKAVLHS